MMYPFLQLDDDTEIVHSEMLPNKKVKVYIEKPVYNGFHSAVCWLPVYEWADVDGFSKDEILKYQEIIESTAHLIMRFAESGGFMNAAGF